MIKVNLYLCLLSIIIELISCASSPADKAEYRAADISDSSGGENTAVSYDSGLRIKSADEVKKDISSIAGYKEVSALVKGYSGIVSDVKMEGDEITFLVRGRKFYFAEGRLLPEEKKEKVEHFRSYGFFNYPENLLPVTEPSDEQLEMIDRYISERQTVSRDNSFLEEVYYGHNFDEILEEMRYINFLSFRFEVHRSLVHRFKAVEREIVAEAETDPELSSFIDSLAEAGSFNWRSANGSRSRSYHSYGIAVDFSPESFGRQQVFWDWSRRFYKKWYMIPYSSRWMVHKKFISAFEKQGFVWGGKWFFFDNMHFEYRPEILILSSWGNIE